MTALPKRLAVIGGGPLGCELAQAFCRLGSHVTIVQNDPKFLPREERDAAEILSRSLARDGVEIRLNTTVVGVRRYGGAKTLHVVNDGNESEIQADEVLLSIGRVPNVEELDLETAGVDFDADQGIKVDDFLRSTNANVYAAGDVCLELKFTNAAQSSACMAVQNALMKETTSDYDKEKLQERLAKLAGGVAIIRVGGSTEVQVKEKKDRVGDAMHATKAAVEEGIVSGGGAALLRARAAIGKLTDGNQDVQSGINIVLRALEAPIRQIAENSGVEGSIVVGKVLGNKSQTFGFDAQTEQYVEMLNAGIVDPAKVVRVALQDAASIAGLMITTEAMVAETPKKNGAPAMPGGGMGGMDY